MPFTGAIGRVNDAQRSSALASHPSPIPFRAAGHQTQTPTRWTRYLAVQQHRAALPSSAGRLGRRQRAASLASSLAFRPGVGAGPARGQRRGRRTAPQGGMAAGRGGAKRLRGAMCVRYSLPQQQADARDARGQPGLKPSQPGPTVRRSSPVRGRSRWTQRRGLGEARIDVACAPPPL